MKQSAHHPPKSNVYLSQDVTTRLIRRHHGAGADRQLQQRPFQLAGVSCLIANTDGLQMVRTKYQGFELDTNFSTPQSGPG